MIVFLDVSLKYIEPWGWVVSFIVSTLIIFVTGISGIKISLHPDVKRDD